PETSAETLIEKWILRTLGARVRTIDRQARWRPLWFVEAERDGERLALVVRGDRGEETPLQFPLRHEMALQQTLHEQGIRVPKVHGWIDELGAYVMDQALGTPDMSGLDETARSEVMREYLT